MTSQPELNVRNVNLTTSDKIRETCVIPATVTIPVCTMTNVHVVRLEIIVINNFIKRLNKLNSLLCQSGEMID